MGKKKTKKNLSKKIKILNKTAKTDTLFKNLSKKSISYSPSINKKYTPTSKKMINLFKCKYINKSQMKSNITSKTVKNLNKSYFKNLKLFIKSIKLNINNKSTECVELGSKKSIKAMLHNIQYQAPLKIKNIIPPKQILSNCWFNTFFVTFFISDKGRKFFKYFRELMVLGKTKSGKYLNNNLRASFILLNCAIEASYNYFGNSGNIARNIDTNYLISFLYNSIVGKGFIKNVNESGNPLKYYESIINCLEDSTINMLNIDQFMYPEITTNNIQSEVSKKNKLPHIITIQVWEDYVYDKQNKYSITHNGNKITYELDSIIIRTTNGEHFGAVLTCNNQEFGFDGASYKRLTSFKWKDLINKNKDWSFKTDFYDPKEYKWNFKNGYQILFYYRV